MSRFFTYALQGQWKNKFDKENVIKDNFHLSDGKTCPVPMMYQETKFRYGRFPEDKVKVLEMPYRGEDITMVLILPTKDTSLPEVLINHISCCPA